MDSFCLDIFNPAHRIPALSRCDTCIFFQITVLTRFSNCSDNARMFTCLNAAVHPEATIRRI